MYYVCLDNGTDVVQPSYTQPVSPENQRPALKPESATKLSSHKKSHDISVHSKTRSGVERQPALPSRETSREPPTFVQELQDVRVKTGDPVELLVEVKGKIVHLIMNS